MPDYLTLVKEKEDEQRQLNARMQTDSDLVYLKKYVLSDAKNVKVPDIINITLNKPAVFAANVISALGSTSQQTIVESLDKGIDTAEVEDFQDAAWAAANARLAQDPSQALLNPFADVQLCLRGRAARRVLFRMDGDELVPDIMPWDSRYVFYESSVNGLPWAAYRTTRSRRQIEQEYQVVVSGKEGKVLDVWDEDHNEIWIDDKKVREQEHSYGFTPVIVQVVSLGYGSILLDTNRIQHTGESIFFLIRDIIPELNRLASILQTLNMKVIKTPMKAKKRGAGTPPEYEDVTGMGAITAMEPDEDIAPIDYGDAKRSAEMLYNIMQRAMEEGSLSSVDLGTLSFPLSAVALVELGEGRDQVFLPRLQTKALLNQATAKMFSEQVIQIGGTVELGARGHKRSFNTTKLKGEYETTYKYTPKSPKTDIARMSVADAASKYYDPETVLADILLVQNPKDIMRKRYLFMAERDFPILRQHREIMAALELAEDGDDDAAQEAQLMAMQMGVTLDQIKQGALPKRPTGEPGTEEETLPLLPLLGEGGQVGGLPGSAAEASRFRAANLRKTPRQSAGGEE